jgi:hypothetical protein
MLEHATRAFRQLNLEAKWETKAIEDTIEDHKLTLPTDLKYLLQIAYKKNPKSDTTIQSTIWQPMRLASTPFATSVCIYGCNTDCTNCPHQYSISPSGIITSTLSDADVLVSYLAYPTDEEGFALIPDDESLKEAIFHFVLYRYWLQKDLMKEEGATQRMNFHLQMWNTLSKKALSLNLPDLGQMENLKNIQNRMVKNRDQFQSLFTNLGGHQSNSF